MSPTSRQGPRPASETLQMKVLGRTLEHFGIQMYKRREAAIAELVANAWDAGAKLVEIRVPTRDEYDPDNSTITITDDGSGMSFEQIRDNYLVLGRNRRKTDGLKSHGRRLMGRKGIGKLAGFGLAKEMTVTTWKKKSAIEFRLDSAELKLADNITKSVEIPWKKASAPNGAGKKGTTVELATLKHKSPIDVDGLRLSLARRFSRTIRGRMKIRVNDRRLPDPTPELVSRVPAEERKLEGVELDDGSTVRYWYGFAKETIKNSELRGFTILVNGKVAQASPFFFNVEATASGQHSTKYVIGEIEADYFDADVDDESDIISTDRQEIDWESEHVAALKKWGEELARRALAECRDSRGQKLENWLLSDIRFSDRIGALDPAAQKQISRFLKSLGSAIDESERSKDLASALIRAFEFQNFHDVIDDINRVADDPEALTELLGQLHDWQVLESRAILEVITGRVAIMDKFENMLMNDAPETAPAFGADNMHDLLAGHPWLLNPEWQVLAEEKTISKQLREWAKKDERTDYDPSRIDFLAIGNDHQLVIVEIKRPDYAVTIDEVNRLQKYRAKLEGGEDREIRMVLICGPNLKIPRQEVRNWETAEDREIRKWSSLFRKTKVVYEHYRALLQSNVAHPDFEKARREVAAARKVLGTGTVYRGKEERRRGIPGQDVDYTREKK